MNEPEIYGRGITMPKGETRTDEQIYRDVCETLINAGVLRIKRFESAQHTQMSWVIKAIKWEEVKGVYETISDRIDAINEAVWDSIGDDAKAELMRQEAAILKQVDGVE